MNSFCAVWFLSHKTSFHQENQVKFVYVGRIGLLGKKRIGSLRQEQFDNSWKPDIEKKDDA